MRLIGRSNNDGFATAANAGMAATSGRWVLLLNPDAWPIEDGIERLVEFAAATRGLGAAGPCLFGRTGSRSAPRSGRRSAPRRWRCGSRSPTR